MNQNIYKQIVGTGDKGMPFWLVTVIATSGSAPASMGMKMIVFADGTSSGTIGGGEIEKKVCQKILQEKPKEIKKWTFELGGANEKVEKTDMLCGGTQEVLVEPLGPVSRLYIIGGGHCGAALSSLASRVGFTTTVIDDRAEWASKSKHPDAAEVIRTDYDLVARHIDFSTDAFIVIMTHDHHQDEKVLRQLLGKEYRYLGMIGSRNKIGMMLDKLRQEGFPENELKRLFAPIGFIIGSHTPEEIAVSIVAQLIAVRNSIEAVAFNSNPLLNP